MADHTGEEENNHKTIPKKVQSTQVMVQSLTSFSIYHPTPSTALAIASFITASSSKARCLMQYPCFSGFHCRVSRRIIFCNHIFFDCSPQSILEFRSKQPLSLVTWLIDLLIAYLDDWHIGCIASKFYSPIEVIHFVTCKSI